MPQAHPATASPGQTGQTGFNYYTETFSRAVYPALDRTIETDIAVIGGGFTGLHTALGVAERGGQVVVLESRHCGWGASGRNGGQLLSDWRSGVAGLSQTYSPEETLALSRLAKSAQNHVKAVMKRYAIEADFVPGALTASDNRRHAAHLRAEYEAAQTLGLAENLVLLDKKEVARHTGSSIYHNGVLDREAGHLHPFKLAQGLAAAAVKRKARIYEETPVLKIEIEKTGANPGVQPWVKLWTRDGVYVKARRVVLACNAYLDGLYPGLKPFIFPIYSYIIATEPLSGAAASTVLPTGVCVCGTRFFLDYYRRTSDGRLLFGGSEGWRLRARPQETERVRAHLKRVYPDLASVPLAYSWSGRVGITRSRMPGFGVLEGGKLWYAHGFSGHGVSLTGLGGCVLAPALLASLEGAAPRASESDEATEAWARLLGLPKRPFYGGEALRPFLLLAGSFFYRSLDKLGW